MRTAVGGGGSALFSRRSFLCVGPMAPSGGQDPQSNLLSPQNTLCYETHTLWHRFCSQFPACDSGCWSENSGGAQSVFHSVQITCEQSCFMIQEGHYVRAEGTDEYKIRLKQLETDENVKFAGTNHYFQELDT